MHLNEWTEQAERWIDMTAWDACDAPVDLEPLRGRPCYGGLDLSTTTDVTALAYCSAAAWRRPLAGSVALLRADRQPGRCWGSFVEPAVGSPPLYSTQVYELTYDNGDTTPGEHALVSHGPEWGNPNMRAAR